LLPGHHLVALPAILPGKAMRVELSCFLIKVVIVVLISD